MGKLFNIARMTTATVGVGPLTLGSPVASFLSFAAAGVADGDVVSYAIEDGTSREVGTGTYAAAGTTLTRSVLSSTNGGAAIALSGSAQVFLTPNALDFAASAISNVPAGSIAATTVQAAIDELAGDVGSQASDLATHEADTTTHGATGAIVGTTNTQTLTAKTLNSFTNVIEADAVHIEVYNNTGSTIAIGTPVYVSGANLGEQLPEVTPADASLLATMPAIGLTEAAIPTGTRGGVDRIGRVANVDTSAYTVGALLYVSETTGQLTATRPSAPAISQQMGRVLYSHATLGVIDVFAADALIPATETAVGGVELATTAEAAARADTSRAVTPAGLDAALDAHEAAADPHAGYLLESLFDANTVLKADSDNTPAALTMGASTILARLAAGNIKAASVAEIVALLQAYTVGGTDVAVADGGTGASTAVGGFTALAAGIPSLSAATTIGLTDNAVLDVGGTPSKITGANFRKTVARSEGLMRAQGFVSWNYDPVVTWSTVTFLSGYFLAASVYFFAGEVITNVHMIVNTAGTSVTKGSVGVFSTSGTLLASSANDTTIWTATAGFRTVALSSPYTVLTEGPLYLGAVAVHTGTNPTINRGQNSTTHGQGIGGGTDRYKFLSGQTDLPNPATWAAQNSHGGWFGAS